MYARERFTRQVWALTLLSACAPLPSELEGPGACGPELEPGVIVAAASDEFVACSSCEPQCFRASDTLRSWDVEERGSNGLVFDPATGGARNPAAIVPCMELPCDVSYGTGATYTRRYDAAARCDPGWVLWWDWGWRASIPDGTHISFEFRAGWTPAELAAATAVSVDVGPTTTRVDHIGLLFVRADLRSEYPLLEVRAVLHASPDGRATPTLSSFYVELQCQFE